MRALLGYIDTDFSKGVHRSQYAYINTYRGFQSERDVEYLLYHKFGEVFVHVEKQYGLTRRTRMDFFVYSRHGNFSVDTFYTDNELSFKVNVRQKLIKYSEFPSNCDLYFLSLNSSIDEDFIESQQKLLHQKAEYQHIHLVSWQRFEQEIAKRDRLTNPPGLVISWQK